MKSSSLTTRCYHSKINRIRIHKIPNNNINNDTVYTPYYPLCQDQQSTYNMTQIHNGQNYEKLTYDESSR